MVAHAFSPAAVALLVSVTVDMDRLEPPKFGLL
jgi:hypothetical protein